MRKRSIIVFLIVSNHSLTSGRIGAVTAATCFPLAERTRGNARSAILLATPIVLILFPTFAACQWKPQANYLLIGVTSTNFGGEEREDRPVSSLLLSISIPLSVPQILCQLRWRTSRLRAPSLLARLWMIVLQNPGRPFNKYIHPDHLGRDLAREEFLLLLLISQVDPQRLQATTSLLQVVPIRYESCPFVIKTIFDSAM